MKPGLMIELDAPMGGKSGKSKDESPEPDMDAVASALSDAFDAYKSGDKEAFVDAMSAAITAKCSEMYDSAPSSEKGEDF